jgi:CRISPR-associated protein Cas2
VILVTYDIPHDGRRTRVAKTLERLGVRVQYSVFVVRGRALAEVVAELERLVVPGQDNVRVHPIDAASEKKAVLIGRAARAEFEPYLIL